MTENAPPRIGTAEVMALIRASSQKGFTGALPMAPQDATFRRARLEEVRRVDPAGMLLDDVEGETTAEVLPPDPVEAAIAPVVDDPARRLAEARGEGYAAGHADGVEEGRATGRAEALAEAQAGLGPARDAFVAALAGLSGGPDVADGLAEVIGAALRRLAAERAGQMIDALPAAFAARVEVMADRVAQGVRAVSVRLHPDDLAAITPHLAGFEVVGSAALVADARLARGDVEVRADGIRLADLLEASALETGA